MYGDITQKSTSVPFIVCVKLFKNNLKQQQQQNSTVNDMPAIREKLLGCGRLLVFGDAVRLLLYAAVERIRSFPPSNGTLYR